MAYWATWADILPIIVEFVSEHRTRALQDLERSGSPLRCVAQAIAAEAAVTGPDFPLKPTWREIVARAR